LYEQIPGSQDASSTFAPGFYTFPCYADIPVISFTFGGRNLPMSSQSFNAGLLSAGSTDCVGTIKASKTGSTVWTLGGVFMTNYYTVFDVGSSQIGFATLA
jgi:hypothetical protein